MGVLDLGQAGRRDGRAAPLTRAERNESERLDGEIPRLDVEKQCVEREAQVAEWRAAAAVTRAAAIATRLESELRFNEVLERDIARFRGELRAPAWFRFAAAWVAVAVAILWLTHP